MRKNAKDLQNNLENVVIPMFCSADLSKLNCYNIYCKFCCNKYTIYVFFFHIFIVANTGQRAKLSKLLSLWESKAKFFDACVISKLQSPDSSMQEYKTNQQNQHRELTEKLIQATNTQLDRYVKSTIFK